MSGGGEIRAVWGKIFVCLFVCFDLTAKKACVCL